MIRVEKLWFMICELNTLVKIPPVCDFTAAGFLIDRSCSLADRVVGGSTTALALVACLLLSCSYHYQWHARTTADDSAGFFAFAAFGTIL